MQCSILGLTNEQGDLPEQRGTRMSDPPETPSLTITVTEAARYLGIGRNTAYEAIRRNEIPSIRIGRRIVIPRHRFLEWLGASDTDEGDAGQ